MSRWWERKRKGRRDGARCTRRKLGLMPLHAAAPKHPHSSCWSVCICVCVCLCLVFLYRNLLPTGSNTELCHSVKHFSWCTQKENYNLHGVWKRKGSAVRHEDSWYPTEDIIFSCAWGPLCLFKEILASKNIRWWKRWPVSQWMERFEVRMWPHWGVRVCNCVCVNIWV